MIKIIAGGKASRDWVFAACHEYEKRLRKPYSLDWQFVDERDLAEKVLALPADFFVVLLDERGELFSSEELAAKLDACLMDGRQLVFVLGGAFGHFPAELKERANLVLSLSKMVFPHQICRLVLIEQLYRAQEINAGHPYHHA